MISIPHNCHWVALLFAILISTPLHAYRCDTILLGGLDLTGQSAPTVTRPLLRAIDNSTDVNKLGVYMIGVMVEGLRGTTKVSFAPYLGHSHKKLFESLSDDLPGSKIVWAGEVLFIETEHGLRIQRANTTSGFFYGLKQSGDAAKESLLTNDTRNLRRFPEILSSGVSLEQFSEESPHLADTLNDTRLVDNLRHSIGNLVVPLITAIDMRDREAFFDEESIELYLRTSALLKQVLQVMGRSSFAAPPRQFSASERSRFLTSLDRYDQFLRGYPEVDTISREEWRDLRERILSLSHYIGRDEYQGPTYVLKRTVGQ